MHAFSPTSLDDRRAVTDYLDRAQAVAERTGEANHFWFAFGSTNVAIHRVWLELELGDPVAAVSAGDAVAAAGCVSWPSSPASPRPVPVASWPLRDLSSDRASGPY